LGPQYAGQHDINKGLFNNNVASHDRSARSLECIQHPNSFATSRILPINMIIEERDVATLT
jgi:hypothetical protein